VVLVVDRFMNAYVDAREPGDHKVAFRVCLLEPRACPSVPEEERLFWYGSTPSGDKILYLT
jgi:hypothetical protein